MRTKLVNGVSVELTSEEEAARDAEEAQAAIDRAASDALAAAEASKLTGTEINGIMCSATREDQNGLAAIALGITIARLNASTFPSTVFKFENGNSLVVTDENFDAIYATWMPFRQSFFAVPL